MGTGVLRQMAAAGKFSLRRHEPPADLAAFLDFFWVLRWDLGGSPAHEQAILPHPNVNLAFETGHAGAGVPGRGAAVYGVDTKIFTRRLTGSGKVLGVRFRPGGFRPFSPSPVSALTDRVVAARDFFGPDTVRTWQEVISAGDDEGMITAAASLLRAAAPEPDPLAGRAAALVRLITAAPGICRVSELADIAGMTERQLQRLFSGYVGVSPKWVLRRARLHEAALRADAGGKIAWARLAADLGYADQAHLTRDFTATIGVSPARYARKC
jgi:AraC-like DNA-binding protein